LNKTDKIEVLSFSLLSSFEKLSLSARSPKEFKNSETSWIAERKSSLIKRAKDFSLSWS
jgi:hypothetical protein